MDSRPDKSALETWLIVLIAAHSAVVGCLLLFATEWSVAFGDGAMALVAFLVHRRGP